MKVKRKFVIGIVISMIIMMSGLLLTTFVQAYFSARLKVITNDGEVKYAKIGMSINMLFDMISSEDIASGTSLGIENHSGVKDTAGGGNTGDDDGFYHYDPTAEWGSANNPYVISNIIHLENLSALQNIGYFEDLVSRFDAEKNNAEASMPYFLICQPNGKPVSINGSKRTIHPIGNETHPFIGYVGGAFDTSTPVMVNGKQSEVSVIYGINVQSTTDVVDVGMFGKIGYQGDASTAIDDQNDEKYGMFIGGASTIRDLLLYDVTITIDEPTWLDTLTSLIQGHLFDHKEEDVDGPHENHHVGILAGHAEFADIKYISVYYSSTEVCAIDLAHTKAYSSGENSNYYSMTGILGFLHFLNPMTIEGYIGPGSDSISSGTIEDSDGTGGGLLSGEGRGYVTASKIYGLYGDAGSIVSYKYRPRDIDENGNEVVPDDYYGLLIIKNGSRYTLEDGTPVSNVVVGEKVVFTDSYQSFFGQNRNKETTWTDFVVKDGDNYLFRGQSLVYENTIQREGIVIRYGYNEENDEPLCTQYVRERLAFGTQATQLYYFTDGVFTFALSNNQDTIENTWNNEDGTADRYAVGENSATQWKPNMAKGSKGVVAYVSQIKSNTQLAAVANANKPLFIMAQNEDGTIFLMTLNQGCDANNNTPGTLLSFSDKETIESYINGYGSGELSSPEYAYAQSTTQEQLISYLQNGVAEEGEKDASLPEWLAINVGTSNQLNELKANYKIKASTTETIYYTFVSNGEYANVRVTINGNSGSYPIMMQGDANTYWDISQTGYFYIEVGTRNTALRHSNYGNTIDTTTNSVNELYETLGTPTSVSYGQNVYRWIRNNTTYTGICIYKDGNNYTLKDGTPVTISNNRISLVNPSDYLYTSMTLKFPSYMYRVAQGDGSYKYYYSDGSELTGEPTSLGMTGTKTDNGTYYERFRGVKKQGGGTVEGVFLEKLTCFKLSNDAKTAYEYYVKITTNGTCGVSTTSYHMWCGTTPPSNTNTSECEITFDDSGSCTIRYTMDGGMFNYIHYDNTSNPPCFGGSFTSSKMYIYTLEALQDISWGRISFDPVEGSMQADLSCDEYVLWPSHNSAVGSTQTADPDYYVVNINNLAQMEHNYYNKGDGEVVNGWLNGSGSINLTYEDLHKKFKMKEGISFSYQISAFNGTISSDDVISAPVGSLGVKADIPKGCVAFRVNGSSNNDYYVRVIVAVPTSEYYRGEINAGEEVYDLDWNNDYYLALWSVEEHGESTFSRFDATTAQEKIELPRSNPYEPGTDPSSANSNYINAIYDLENNLDGTYSTATTNRAYLNGSRVLVAYAFKVQGEGVYILGTANSTGGFPMEIVYFSADATASAGRDGSTGSTIGSIDFVYDNGTDILVVKDSSGDSTGYTDAYYASLCRLFLDNTAQEDGIYVDINDAKVYIQRTLVQDVPVIYFETSGTDDAHVLISRYRNLDSDIVASKKKDDSDYTWDPSAP